jgi:multidrug efflux system outer membrane protein
MRRAALGLSAAALLSACAAVGPDYQRPAITLPAQYPQSDVGSAALATDWWRAYGDATLTQLVEKALAANADIAQAVARVEFAEGQLREASGAQLPAVSAGANAGRAQLGVAVPSNPYGVTVTGNDFKLGLSASYEIDLWGRLRRATEAARAGLLASAAARDTVRLSVAGAVAQGWFALRSLDEQIVLTRATLATREAGARLNLERVKAGVGSALDAEQAEILRADAALQLRELQRQRALAQTLLGLLTAEPTLALPEGRLGAGPLPPLPPAGLPSALLERRPDIRSAEEALVAANAQIGVARAAMFPSLSLTGALGHESSALSTLLKSPARFWSAGFGLALPLFDGGRNQARTDQAGAKQREAVGAYQGVVASAFKEVADALASLSAARESQGEVQRRDAAASHALQLARARFDAGYTGYLELLDAQRTATAAQLDVVRNRQAQLSASVDLVKALGGGWEGPAAM